MTSRLAIAVFLLLAQWACSPPAPPAPKRKAPEAPAEVKITHFYASPGVLSPGQASIVCYGVENADAVELAPPVEAISPSYNRCFSFSPKQSTTLRLTARGKSGEADASFRIVVRRDAAGQAAAPPPEPLIRFFTASSTSVARGMPVTVCYGLSAATEVTVEPALSGVEAVRQKCVSFTPQATTTYTMTARAPGGLEDKATLSIRVE